jgi:ABC-type multidrug transport system permease subunit
MTIRTLFGLLVVIAPLHMGEQLITGIDELYRIKEVLAVYLGWFDDPDYAIVVLATIAGTMFLLLAYGLLLGGRARQVAIGVFAVVAVTESHHFVTAFARGGYAPGVVTAIPFVIVGVLMLREIFRSAKVEGS